MRTRVEGLPFVRWVGPYEPAYRIDPELINDLDSGRLPRQRYNIQTYRYGAEQKDRLAQWIPLLGGTVDQNVPEGYTMQATLTNEQVAILLHFDEVFFIDKWSPMQEDMDIVRQFGGADYIESVAGYSGQGVRGQVRDGGVRATHMGFQQNPLLIRSNTGDTGHGTSTTGIVFGTGAGNPAGRGMLPNGQGIFLAGLTTGSARYNETAALLQAPYFGVFESNSTGSTQTTAYTTDSFTMDDILFRMNILICQSQSNLGNQNSRPQAWAKNIVSVGGIKHMNTLTTADDNWTGGASIGPAQDGRIKPDLAHFYDWVTCASSTTDSSYTTTFNGTSAATPITCGHFGLLFQMWADGVFGQTVVGNTVFDARPWNSTAKALMINTASQWNFSGSSHDLTRTHQGWGRADVRNMFDLRTKMFIVDESVRLTNLQSKTYRLMVLPNQPELKVTMVYTDPPGTTSSTQHRINDLTLKVTSPNGTIYYGNNGLLANMYSTPGGAPNTKDTVENVFVQNPEVGLWTVTVSADELNADAELSTPGVVDADFALVVSGVHAEAGPDLFQARQGVVQGGGLPELQTSNNQRLSMNSPLLVGNAYQIGCYIEGTAPNSRPEALKIRMESSCTAPEVAYFIYLEEPTGGRRNLVATGATSPSDGVITVNLPEPYRWVYQGSNRIKMTIEFRTPQGSQNSNWSVAIDQVRFLFVP